MTNLINFGRRVKIFMAKGPAYHRVYGRWRLQRWLNSRLARPAHVSDAAFMNSLKLDEPALLETGRAWTTGNYQQAKTTLRGYFQTRTAPRFAFEPEHIETIVSLVDGEQKQNTLHSADQICRNIFCFRGADPVRFENGIDWTRRPHDNIDWTWDLNRHAYFETLGRAYHYTGDERYARKFRELLLDWLAKNPAGVRQANWSSVFEVAYRINTWLWAFFYFRSAAAFDDELCWSLLKGLLAHGRYLAANLEYHVQNNHLLLEAKALAMLGLLFPEFKPAKKWRLLGLKIVYQQLCAQVSPDGVHREQSSFYHQVIAGEMLELLVLLANNQVSVPPAVREIFSRMVEFELWLTRPDGQMPLLSDSSWETTYPRFSATRGGPVFLDRADLHRLAPPPDEGCFWLLGPGAAQLSGSPITPAGLGSRAFPEGGYFVMRQGQGPEAVYLVFDGGPFGYSLVPGHGHADALSFELYAHGQTWLVDPGVYARIRTREGDAWRNFFRSSRAHNTIVVDDQDQSVLVDTSRVYRSAQVTLHSWFSGEDFDFVDASHNGYERLPEPVTHRRQIFFAGPEYWVVIDSLEGQGEHCFDLYFHLAPGLETCLDPVSHTAYIGHGAGPGLIVCPVAGPYFQADLVLGETEPIQGWVAFSSGEKQPAPTLRYRQVAAAPVQLCTVLYPYPAQNRPALTVSEIEVKVQPEPANGPGPAGSRITGLQIETGNYRDYLVVDRGGSGRVFKAWAGYKTDAQLLYMRQKKEDHSLVRVVMRGGSLLFWQDQVLLPAGNSAWDISIDRAA